MIWVFTTVSKRSPVRVIFFILTELKNEKYPCMCMIAYEGGYLTKSTDVTNLILDEFSVAMEITSIDALCSNVNN